MRAFIVRPFGEKQDIDFDKVQRDLIDPAMRLAGIAGDTTAEILEAGDIRADMFDLLLLADLVIADVSVDNANVYYELGIRHALRSKRTQLIRASGVPKPPFDIGPDRYIQYDRREPKNSVSLLERALRHTMASDGVDSPVFRLLPDLKEQDRASLIPAPREFQEEAEHACAKRDPGRLALLGWEAQGFNWELGGARVVGRSLFKLEALEPAKRVWERVRKVDSADIEANLSLGTIHQRWGDLVLSDQALRRVLDNRHASAIDRAEALALAARNEKTRLKEGCRSPDVDERQKKVLRSPHFLRCYESYRRAFLANLNHYYSGLNALALASVAPQLIAKQPAVWQQQFDTEEEASSEIKKLEKQRAELAGAVGLSLEAARLAVPEGARDGWLEISEADFQFLTAERPRRLPEVYERAIDAMDFKVRSARAQLTLYRDLGIFEDRVDACLAVFPAEKSTPAATPKLRKAILFTGHMVDAPSRSKPRFPHYKVPIAAAAINAELERIANGDSGGCLAFAGGASGGDMLFHEACASQGIASRLRLALPAGSFKARSVTPANADWENRFQALIELHQKDLEILQNEEELPAWLTRKSDYNIWGRTNVWMLEEALASGAEETHLLALWNGQAGDGPGGTAHLIELAKKEGVSTHILNTKELFGF